MELGNLRLSLEDLKRIFVNIILSQKLCWGDIQLLVEAIQDELQNIPIKKD